MPESNYPSIPGVGTDWLSDRPPPKDDRTALLCIAALVVSLLVIRACIPPNWHHPAERPATPPESLYR